MHRENAAKLGTRQICNRNAGTKRRGNSLERNMANSPGPFCMSWSQRGHDIYMIFERNTLELNLQDFDVALTDQTCTIRVPGLEKHWNFFLEVKAKDAHRVQNDNRLIIVVPKKDPTLCWPSLKLEADTSSREEVSEPIVPCGDEPPPEKILHQSVEVDNTTTTESVSSEEMAAEEKALSNVTIATGTIVTNGILKGGDRPVGAGVQSEGSEMQSTETEVNGPKFQHSGACHHLTSVKHDWYNSGNEMIVLTLYIPHLDPWGCNPVFLDDQLQISFKTGDEKFHTKHDTTSEVMFVWKIKLSGEIVPEKCTHRVNLKNMEIKLVKKKAERWSNLMDVTQQSPKDTSHNNCESDEENLDLFNEAASTSGDGASEPVQSVWYNNLSNNSLNKSAETGSKPGCTGLDNVGNTCFMNSVLQALANTVEVRDYFVGKHFKKDINLENPLGMKGRMAEEFSAVVGKLWSSKTHSFAPSKFRWAVGEKESRFTDYMQHDAQEFMAFLLDQLHEDVNRIKDKPYYEIKEQEGKPDHLVAEESWKLHKSRNDSFIVDLFHGIFKSKLVCPECDKHSTKFDPFLFLSVLLPKATRLFTLYFLHKDPDKTPVQLTVTITKHGGTAQEVFDQVAKLMKCSIDHLRMFEVYRHRIHRFFVPDSSLDKVLSTDVIFVQEAISPSEAGEPVYEVVILQRRTEPEVGSRCTYCDKTPGNDVKIKRCLKCLRVAYCDQQCQRCDWPQHRKTCQRVPDLVGFPFVASLKESCTSYDNIKTCLIKYARHSIEISYFQSSEITDDDVTVNDGLNFHITPINWSGTNIETPLIDFGNLLHYRLLWTENHSQDKIDLKDYKFLAMDWNTDSKSPTFVKVFTKQFEPEVLDVGEQTETANLYDCIRLFTKPEVLAPEEAWYCPRCKEHREATKEMSLWQLPDILIVQLKRFSFKNHLWRDKIDMFVDFPTSGLDMSPYCITKRDGKPQIYDLFAVVNHHGGIFGGHYTSYVRLSDLGNSRESTVGWRLCDDSHVTRIPSEKQVVTKAAYVMLYRRRESGNVYEMTSPSPCAPEVAQERGENASQDDISMEAAGPSGLVNQMGDGNHLTTSRKNSDESCSPPRNNSFDDDMDGYRSDASDLINVSPLHSPKLPPSALVKYDDVFELDEASDMETGEQKMTSLGDSPTEASPSAHEESETSLPIKTVEPQVTTEENEISLDYTDMDAVD
ncbi:ubiquitin carboxyl-terminal hydrolase 19-like isoform X3 [Clavelina lepadiformis]|uniref:ubiquitin carboxyl-terminal hydrolase 19-like isoform X3 n=1 Tax=Clavelina lepadiformis TaxID=159417 RepID=UPI004042455E